MSYFNKLITVLGPTAIGKTRFASELAYKFNGEIISADSRQVYRGMDIGTGKDYDDYLVNGQRIKTHLIDVIDPAGEFNLFLFAEFFEKALNDILENKKLPFLVGGTGLYLNSVLQNYSMKEVNFNSSRADELNRMSVPELKERLFRLNPSLHNTTDTIHKDRIIKAVLIAEANGDPRRLKEDLDILVIGLLDERETVKKRIRERLKSRLKNGMIEEAENLLKSGITHEKLDFFGLEYKFLSLYLSGKLNYNDMYQKLASSIIQFSKRQMTWFRKMEKEGVVINWFRNSDISEAESLVNNFLEKDVPSR